MKKLFVIVSILSAVCTGSASAQTKTPSAVLSSFQSSFASTGGESWSNVRGLYRVDFTQENEKVAAFFNLDGDLIASSRNVTLQQIPMSLKSDLQKHFDKSEISSLFEVDKEDGIVYYATIRNDKNKLELESTSSGSWITKF